MDIDVWILLLTICLVFMALGVWAIRALFPGVEATLPLNKCHFPVLLEAMTLWI